MNLETLVLPIKADSSGFNTAMKAVTATVGAAVAAMGVMVKATFDWADELDSLQDIMGVTNKTAAALNFTLRKSGTQTQALTKGMTILEKGLVKADGTLDTIGKSLKDFGINALDANGAVKDQGVLLDEIAGRYANFSTQQERVNFLTETFGRAGADLIDFFDTLASEGGIDTVAEKVERLGLAIDPNRYEQFNRNLEELKLVGLGLAVSFTESVMPALEDFLGIINDPNLTFGQKVQEISKGVGEFVSTWYNQLKTELAAIDWKQVSTQIANTINSINWAQAGLNFSKFIKDLSEGMTKAAKEFDWLAVGNALASALNNFLAGMFGMTEAQLQRTIKMTLNQLSINIQNWVNNTLAYLQGLGLNIKAGGFTMPKFDMSIPRETPRNSGGSGSPGVQAGGYTYQNGVYTLNRASGGPVIAGQTYNVSEFFQPERFTPAVNGRVDPIGGGSQEVTARIDEERLARVLVSVLQPLLA